MKNRPLHERFGFALDGLRVVWRSERSFRTECGFAVAALIALLILRPGWQWAAMIAICTMVVMALELLNSALEYLIEIRNAGTGVRHSDLEPLRRFQHQGERDFSVARVSECIPCNFGCSRRQPNLVLIVESKFRGHFASTLPGVNNVSFGDKAEMNYGNRHSHAAFVTTTLTSSR